MKKICILGSEGQVGKALEEFLIYQNYDVTGIDIVKNLFHDLRASNSFVIEHSIENSDFVFFLAFDVGGSRYLKKYQHEFEFIENNTAIMKETFSLLKKYNKPFLFASSQMSNMSYSPYGITKALGECYTKALNGIIVKFWNVYGIEKDLEKSHVITDFILKAKNNKVIDMLTDGNEERQMLYSRDCCECLEVLMKRYDTLDRSKELHITNFEWFKIIDIAKIIASFYPGTEIKPAKEKDLVQLNKRNEPDPYILSLWNPKTTLRQGISEIVKHYEQNKNL